MTRSTRTTKFQFSSSLPYVKLIDDSLGTNIRALLELLAKSTNMRYGLNYELGSKTRQYYANVDATVLFNLFSCHLLSEKELRLMQDSVFYLRDSNPNAAHEKPEGDKYAWDVVEGPSSFTTALACYSLLITGDRRVEEIGRSLRWLLGQRNDNGIWPTFKKGEPHNYVTTLYSILALKLWPNSNREFGQEINTTFKEVKEYIENSFVRTGDYYWVGKYESSDVCLSNTIACLYLLKILRSSSFGEVYNGAKKVIEQTVLENEDWYISTLSDVRANNRIKTMYTYNPAYLLLLLRLGWEATDRVVLKMFHWLLADLKNFWMRKNIVYPWRSSDSVIQSFICSFSIQCVFTWIRRFLNRSITNAEEDLDKIVSGKDVFLCHASEDKEEYVKVLYDGLSGEGISVWYDEGEILWGDSITERIEEGIKLSRFAIICFSENFLRKNWPDSEFRNLYQRQQSEGRKILLPLILNAKEKVFERYPLIRDIACEEWEKGSSYLISQIKKILKQRDVS